MSYRELYQYCQGLPVPISSKSIQDKILELIPGTAVRVVATTGDASLVRGCYLSARNLDHPFVRQAGGRTVIALVRSLNRCWRRLVLVKELMHLYDDPLQSTNVEDDFDALLHEFCGAPSGQMSVQMTSEVRCLWMAVGLLCPEEKRAELQQKRENEAITDLQIAHELKVPEKYVPFFFHPRIRDYLSELLEHKSP